MRSPYGMQLVEDCRSCQLGSEDFFCRLPEVEIEAFRRIKFSILHPAGARLFLDGQTCRGVYFLCSGRVKLTATSSDGHTVIFKIAKPGEVLGLNTSIQGSAHNMTAETCQPCQLNFVKQADFLEYLQQYGKVRLQTAIQLSRECNQAFHQIRSLSSHTGAQRIARLMLDFLDGSHLASTTRGIRVAMALTREEIGQIIAMSRETVSRTLTSLREQGIAEIRGSNLLIHNMTALKQLVC